MFTWEIPQNDVSRSFPNRNLVNDEHSYGTGIEYLYIYIYKVVFFLALKFNNDRRFGRIMVM